MHRLGLGGMVRLKKLAPVRKLLQCAAFLACNPFLSNIPGGKLYTGKWKNFCSPGLNCYSCPAAALSCPIGAMQAVSGSSRFNFSFYVAGFLLTVGLVFGRAACAFLCPFGLLQELLHKIPSRKFRLPRPFRYVKYAVVLVFVLILPVADTNFAGSGDPAFCKYICPAGTLEGGLPLLATHPELRSVLGALFSVKAAVLALVLAASVFVSRFFCKSLCPLGAIYGLMNKISLTRLSVDQARCTRCGSCERVCPMDVNPVREARSAECIFCMHCAASCPEGAVKLVTSFSPRPPESQG